MEACYRMGCIIGDASKKSEANDLIWPSAASILALTPTAGTRTKGPLSLEAYRINAEQTCLCWLICLDKEYCFISCHLKGFKGEFSWGQSLPCLLRLTETMKLTFHILCGCHSSSAKVLGSLENILLPPKTGVLSTEILCLFSFTFNF